MVPPASHIAPTGGGSGTARNPKSMKPQRLFATLPVLATVFLGLLAPCARAADTGAGAAFTYAPTSPASGDPVAFSDRSTGEPIAWSWAFGDGTTSALRNPQHTYMAGGSYTVTLAVGDSTGWRSTSCALAVRESAPVVATSASVSAPAAAAAAGPAFTITQTLSDEAQRTTLAFAGLAMPTGNLDAQSFFPPGKVADYTGFQYLRDNDPDDMGHNTSFLTRVANNVIYILNDAQFAQLKTLATAQQNRINLYGYKRFALMKAFRRLLDGDLPSGATGLNLDAVERVSRELYLIDGQISFDRALLYASILNSLDSTQKASLAAMKGKGWSSWPDITSDQIKTKMSGLSQGTGVAVMTYAGDLFSWYAGSVAADVYFCPERHGTYFGSFYIKDAPAIGHEGYSISEQLTATAGAALCDSAKGYVTTAQAALVSGLVDTQRNNLYAASPTSIVQVRTEIATLLRGLLSSTATSDNVRAQVLLLSSAYGELDGEDNYHYATVFNQVYRSLTTDQKAKLAALRKSIMSGTYADGTPFDFSSCTTPFLYSAVISDESVLTSYVGDTDYLFRQGTAESPAFSSSTAAPTADQAVQFTDKTTGGPTSWSWTFGDGGSSTAQNPSHAYAAAGTYTVTLITGTSEGSFKFSSTALAVTGASTTGGTTGSTGGTTTGTGGTTTTSGSSGSGGGGAVTPAAALLVLAFLGLRRFAGK